MLRLTVEHGGRGKRAKKERSGVADSQMSGPLMGTMSGVFVRLLHMLPAPDQLAITWLGT